MFVLARADKDYLLEAGWVQMVDQLVTFLKRVRIANWRNRYLESDLIFEPFQIRDSKILSIFIGWAFLLGISAHVFFVERICPAVMKNSVQWAYKVNFRIMRIMHIVWVLVQISSTILRDTYIWLKIICDLMVARIRSRNQ